MEQQATFSTAGTNGRWATPAGRRRGVLNITSASAVMFATQGAGIGGVVAVVLGRTQPTGLVQAPPRPVRGAAIGAIAGGLTGVLLGAVLGTTIAVFERVRPLIEANRAASQPASENAAGAATDAALSGTASGQS